MPPAAHPRIDALLTRMVADGEFPGAAYAIGTADATRFAGSVGRLAVAPAPEVLPGSPVYDLASLTKPLAAAAVALRLSSSGRLDLARPVRDLVAGWGTEDRSGVTPLDLLLHRSGLPAWEPLYLRSPDPEEVLAYLGRRPLERTPGTRAVYSCPGYVALGLVIEAVTGRSLEALFESEVAVPLDLRSTGFRPARSALARIAPTERGNERERAMVGAEGDAVPWPGKILRGIVHDRNARHLGGAAGNAGLFGTALEVDRILRAFLVPGLLDASARAAALRPDVGRGAEIRTVGFQSARTAGSAAGGALSSDAVGHTGFTGTSAWIDPVAGRTFVLLTNRVHPRYRPEPMHPLRRTFHAAAAAALAAEGL